MANVTVYVKDHCPYCVRAEALLKKKGVAFDVIDVTHDQDKRDWLVETTRQRTLPQTFIDGHSVGGCDDLYALEREGKLDALLAGPSDPAHASSSSSP